MGNIHTLPISCVDPVMSLVRVANRQVIEFASDVVRRIGVGVPIGVHPIGGNLGLLVAI